MRSRPRGTLRTPASALLAALLAGAPLLPGVAAGAERDLDDRPVIYKWVDENGIAHYTTDRERIPERLRDRFPVPDEPRDEPEGAARRAPAPAEPVDRGFPPPAPERDPGVPAGPSTAAPSDRWSTMDRGSEPDPVAGDVVERDLRAEGDFVAVETGAAASAALDERIRVLEEEIRADEDALKALLSMPADQPLAAADDSDLRAIAERLPDRLQDLRALRDERGEPEATEEP